MWSSLRFVIFLSIFETVFDHVKCKGMKTFVPVSTTTKSPVTHTRRYNVPVIQWMAINTDEEKNTTITAQAETVTADPNATADPTAAGPTATKGATTNEGRTEYHNNLKTKVTLKTWEPVEPAELDDNITTTISTTSTTSNYSMKNNDDKYVIPNDCKLSKATDVPFDMRKMADIWQTVYYQLPHKVQCFKIYIKKISDDERSNYLKTYGTFDDKVNWNKIFLEVKAVTYIGRKHFLQGSNMEKGVLKNIIIIKENSTHILHEESADQWLVVQKLLLMRDCDSGGVVVFSKVPNLPLQLDVRNALEEFGEEYGDGKPACNDDEVVNKYYETDDEDVEKLLL